MKIRKCKNCTTELKDYQEELCYECLGDKVSAIFSFTQLTDSGMMAVNDYHSKKMTKKENEEFNFRFAKKAHEIRIRLFKISRFHEYLKGYGKQVSTKENKSLTIHFYSEFHKEKLFSLFERIEKQGILLKKYKLFSTGCRLKVNIDFI